MRPPGFLSLLIALVALSIVFGICERVAFSVPRKRLLRRERAVDFAWWFFTPWISRTASTIAIVIAVALTTIVIRAAGLSEPSHGWFDGQPRLVQILELLILADLLGYFAHRMFHGRTL